jgi:hypothetical protein
MTTQPTSPERLADEAPDNRDQERPTTNDRAIAAARWTGAFVLLVVAVLVMFQRSRGRYPDDAFIFFRYARNIATGDGWAYNPGDSAANGATSPLWTLVLAGAYLVRRDMESNAWLLYAGLLASTGLLSFAALRRTGQVVAGVVAAPLIVLNPVLLRVRGMESALFLALASAVLLVGCWSGEDGRHPRRRAVLLGVLSALLVLVRPEGAILVGLVLLLRWFEDRRLPWLTVLSAALTALPWTLYSTVAFGSPVAGTLAAKSAQTRSGYFGSTFEFIRYLERLDDRWWSIAVVALAAVGLVAGLAAEPSRRFVLVLTTFAACQFLGYGLVVRPPVYHWYYAVTYWTVSILAAIGIAAIARFVAARLAAPSRSWVAPAVAAAGATLVVGLQISGQVRGDVYQGYEMASEWIVQNSTEDQSVSATEIGVVGWFTDRPMVDYLGLLSRESADEVGRGDLASWLERERPDFYIQHAPIWAMESQAAALPWFSAAYVPVYDSPVDDSSRVVVFQRVRDIDDAIAKPRPQLPPALRRELVDREVRLDDGEELVLASLLSQYVADESLQRRFEGPDGVDLSALVLWAADTGAGGPDAAVGVERLGARLAAAGGPVVVELAPRS